MEATEDQKSGTAQVQSDPDASEQDAKALDICKFFLKGKCHFGDRCRLSHRSTSKLADCELVQLEEKGCKKQKTRRKSGKTDKVKVEESKGPEKKQRMRTADDVISRILWDSTVDPADFIVGHLDRFLGVLERPFSDFSWDTQLCDCDYSEEMAIPRHRIQYFSYKGQRLWDRDSRTDHVFGSTGQLVMYPFDQWDQKDKFAPAEDGEGSPVEENEQDGVNHKLMDTAQEDAFNDTEDTLDGSTNKQMGKDCEGVGIAQEVEVLSISKEDEQITTQDESTETWKKEETVAPVQSIPQVPLPGRKRRSPTHFICFRVDSPAVLHAFQQVQKKVLSHLPESESLFLKPGSLHVTLSLLVLPGPAEVFAASELFCSVVKNFYKPPISVMFTPRLRHFNGKVLHVVPEPLSDIQYLNAPFQEAFREKGWLHRDSRDPSYHLTLAKVTEIGGEKIFENVWKIKLENQVNFGKLTVDKLYLCVKGGQRSANGFYETVCSVQLPNV